MSEEIKEKDVIIKAYPNDNKALVEGNTAEGMLCVKAKFPELHAAKESAISGDEVNDLIAEIRERKLSFSFRLGDK